MTRKVNLNGVYYTIMGDVLQTPINPWTAQIAGTGLEYSTFQKVNIEEWHDFRNGIGIESALPNESARTWWCNGTDTTTSRSAVLGGLVTTAGSFGVAPVKIIDFRGETYGIGSNTIAVWNATTSAWDAVTAASALAIEDCEDAWDEFTHADITSTADTSDKQVGSASAKLLCGANQTRTIWATEAFTAKNLSAYTYLRFWFKWDKAGGGNYTSAAFDLLLDDTANCASPLEDIDITGGLANTWEQKTIPLANPGSDTAIISIGLKAPLFDTEGVHIDAVEAITLGALSDQIDAIVIVDGTSEYLVVSAAGAAIYSEDGETWTNLAGCQGYLAPFGNKLYSIDIDGRTVRASAAGNVDGTWTTFSLTGDFGTVHRLFSGKLLADSTPTLYFTSTKGLFSIDVTNELAYKQEITYPPLDNAGRVGMYFNANIWVATGAGITKVAPSMATPVGPDLDDGLPSGYQGDVYDMEGVSSSWIVYCINGGTTDKSSIIKRNTNIGGNIPVYTTSAVNNAIACLHHSPSSLYTNGGLWWGEGTNIKYMMFPDTTSNVKQVPTYQYVAASDAQGLILPKFRKLASIKKTALTASAVTEDCNADEYITLYHKINNASTWTELGTFKTSPRPTMLTFASGLGLEFYVIQFAVKLQRGTTNTNSPGLESLAFAWRGKPVRISSWTLTIDCTEQDGNNIFDRLEAVYDLATLVAFYPSGDTNKTSHNVAISRMPQRAWWENQGRKEGLIQVTLEEVFGG